MKIIQYNPPEHPLPCDNDSSGSGFREAFPGHCSSSEHPEAGTEPTLGSELRVFLTQKSFPSPLAEIPCGCLSSLNCRKRGGGPSRGGRNAAWKAGEFTRCCCCWWLCASASLAAISPSSQHKNILTLKTAWSSSSSCLGVALEPVLSTGQLSAQVGSEKQLWVPCWVTGTQPLTAEPGGREGKCLESVDKQSILLYSAIKMPTKRAAALGIQWLWLSWAIMPGWYHFQQGKMGNNHTKEHSKDCNTCKWNRKNRSFICASYEAHITAAVYYTAVYIYIIVYIYTIVYIYIIVYI